MEELAFKSPATIAVSGATSSGKTQLVMKLIRNAEVMFNKPVTRIIYFYCQYQNLFSQMESEIPIISFHPGLPDDEVLSPCNAQSHSLLIADDLMNEITNSAASLDLITKASHHRCISIIYLTQNMFHQAVNELLSAIEVNPHPNLLNAFCLLIEQADERLVDEDGFENLVTKTVECIDGLYRRRVAEDHEIYTIGLR